MPPIIVIAADLIQVSFTFLRLFFLQRQQKNTFNGMRIDGRTAKRIATLDRRFRFCAAVACFRRIEIGGVFRDRSGTDSGKR
ncbi:MAG: hypothetical protein ABGZ53_31235 [Fuerstiella sp.]|jgi:hypothetical protein